MTLTRTEAYLSTFHDANPGVTSRTFEALPVTCGERAFSSTYASLISMLPDADATADAQPLTVLDLACGDGHLLALLHASHPDGHLALIGVDLSAGELAAARARLGEGAALYRCKAQQLPLASGSVDVVFCHLALMLMDDADGVMRELRRVLKPGGLFAGVVGARPAANPALDLFIALYAGASKRPEVAGMRFGDARWRSEDGIRSLLEPAFDSLALNDLHATRRCTPAQLWDWFLGMYDTDLLTPDGREDLRQRYLLALRPLCSTTGPDGDLQFEERYRQFSARVAL